MWNAVYISFGIQPPSNIKNLFGSWFRNASIKIRNLILIGAAVLCWAIWLTMNDVVIKKSKSNSCN